MKLRYSFAICVVPFIAACETMDHSAPSAAQARAEVFISRVSEAGIGDRIGRIDLSDTAEGLVLAVKLEGVPPGQRGFHVHEKGDCGPALRDGKPVAALAAGGHFDASGAGRHEGPHGHGHTGDLPVLDVDASGKVDDTLTAPRLQLSTIRGRAIMIHAGGDNYSDQPQPLGGGGARIACGVIPQAGS